jgi:DNA-directed RNA polymerase beta subunit
LVLHFATYARVDKYGFLLTPYRSILHEVKNDGVEAINKIVLNKIVGDD